MVIGLGRAALQVYHLGNPLCSAKLLLGQGTSRQWASKDYLCRLWPAELPSVKYGFSAKWKISLGKRMQVESAKAAKAKVRRGQDCLGQLPEPLLCILLVQVLCLNGPDMKSTDATDFG